jgi:hypothetical protein
VGDRIDLYFIIAQKRYSPSVLAMVSYPVLGLIVLTSHVIESSQNNWREEVIQSLVVLEAQHTQQQLQLELEVEVNPLDASYSVSLCDLMRQEEAAAAQGRHSQREKVAARVDLQMNQETKAHFSKQGQLSMKRWQMLFKKQRKDREKWLEEFQEQCRSW